MINSCIYTGTVIHKRFKPKKHFFKYKVFSLFIDLSELEILSDKIRFFSLNRFNLISFQEKDHGERDGSSLTKWVEKHLKQNNIKSENISRVYPHQLFCDNFVKGRCVTHLSLIHI